MGVYNLSYWMQSLAEIFYDDKAFGFVVVSPAMMVFQHLWVSAFAVGFSLPTQLWDIFLQGIQLLLLSL